MSARVAASSRAPRAVGRDGRRPESSSLARRVWTLLALALLGWALARALAGPGPLLNPAGWPLVERFLAGALHPSADGALLRRAFGAAATTLAFATVGTLASLAAGAVGAVLASERWWRAVASPRGGSAWRAPWLAVRALLALPRALHEIVWGLLFVAVVGLGPLAGVLAIAVPYGAICAKVFSELLDEADPRPFSSLLGAGVPPLRALLLGLVPGALPDLLSYALYRFECSLRAAAVLGIVGAGGLGYEIFLSLQSLRYGQVWTFLYVLLALIGLADLWSGALRRRIGGRDRVSQAWRGRGAGAAGKETAREGSVGEGSPGEGWVGEGSGGRSGRPEAGGSLRDLGDGRVEGAEPGSGRRGSRGSRLLRHSGRAVAALAVASLLWLGPELAGLVDPALPARLVDLLSRALPPESGGRSPAELLRLVEATAAMSVLGIAGATAIGFVLSFPAAGALTLPGGPFRNRWAGVRRLLPGRLLRVAARGILLLLRGVPAPIWALVVLFVLFPGILPGALALALYTGGVLGRLLAEAVENLDPRPARALAERGAGGAAVFLYAVLPAVASRTVAYGLYRWEETIRATAMVGLVGAGGLGRALTEDLTSFDYPAVTTLLLCYFLLAVAVDLAGASARRAVRAGA